VIDKNAWKDAVRVLGIVAVVFVVDAKDPPAPSDDDANRKTVA